MLPRLAEGDETNGDGGQHLGVSLYDRALAVLAHARPTDAADAIRILSAMATAADLRGEAHQPRPNDRGYRSPRVRSSPTRTLRLTRMLQF